jgi:hypothetical protein
MVDHDVQDDRVVLGDSPDIVPGTEFRIDLEIRLWSESAIAGRREGREDVDSAAEEAREGALQDVFQTA